MEVRCREHQYLTWAVVCVVCGRTPGICMQGGFVVWNLLLVFWFDFALDSGG